jgi:hypothetical protein
MPIIKEHKCAEEFDLIQANMSVGSPIGPMAFELVNAHNIGREESVLSKDEIQLVEMVVL